MARKKGYTINFQFEDYPRQIRDSVMVAKWNPHLALDWMNGVGIRVTSPIHIKQWNTAAKQINHFWDSIVDCRWYSERAFWKDAAPERLNAIEENITLEDYAAMVKFEKVQNKE